jgi:hypothetical protein
MKHLICLCLLLTADAFAAKKKPAIAPALSPLDRYVSDSRARLLEAPPAAPGSIWTPGSRLADAARDRR